MVDMGRSKRRNRPKQRAVRNIPIGNVVTVLSKGIGQGCFGTVLTNKGGWVKIQLYDGTVVRRRRKNVWLPIQPELFCKDSEGRFLHIGNLVRITFVRDYNFNTVGKIVNTEVMDTQNRRVTIVTDDGNRISINSRHVCLIPTLPGTA